MDFEISMRIRRDRIDEGESFRVNDGDFGDFGLLAMRDFTRRMARPSISIDRPIELAIPVNCGRFAGRAKKAKKAVT